LSADATFLIQFLLPTRDGENRPVSRSLFAAVRATLTERFGGVTAYQRSPASGLWKRPDGGIDGDEVVMVEVATHDLDRAWWAEYRRELERQFSQETIFIRAIRIETL
jgi:hypothetical protein